jgi:hypothetical protein
MLRGFKGELRHRRSATRRQRPTRIGVGPDRITVMHKMQEHRYFLTVWERVRSS